MTLSENRCPLFRVMRERKSRALARLLQCRCDRDQRVTTTLVPTDTRLNRSEMSALSIRMQPYDTKPPTEPGMLVPWMAYSPPESVIAATPIGLRGEPPGITSGMFGLSGLTSFGGQPARVVPSHCLPARPTPTG